MNAENRKNNMGGFLCYLNMYNKNQKRNSTFTFFDTGQSQNEYFSWKRPVYNNLQYLALHFDLK